MKNSIGLLNLVGFTFVSAASTLLHFLFDWTNKSIFVASFSAVNESTFEHMKILFFPLFIFAIVQSLFVSKVYPQFWCVKLKSIVLGVVLIPILFYTYNGIFGVSPALINVLIFFISAAISFIYETKALKNEFCKCPFPYISLILLCVIAFTFMVFTFIPPQIPLFLDPVTKTYGLQ